MTEAHALARLRQQVGRVGHALHAARENAVDVARANRLGGEHHGLEAGTADLVDREAPDGVGHAGGPRDLAGRVLTQACAEDVAEDALLDGIGLNARASHGLGRREGSEFGGAERGKGALETADRGPTGAGDDDVLQGSVGYESGCWMRRPKSGTGRLGSGVRSDVRRGESAELRGSTGELDSRRSNGPF